MFGWNDKSIKVREGAHYVTKCGTIVGPAIYNPSSVSPGRNWEINGCHYHGNGTAFGRHDGWALELIAEIPGELRGLIVGRDEYDHVVKRLRNRVQALESALSAFSTLRAAIEVAATIKLPDFITASEAGGTAPAKCTASEAARLS